MFGTEALRLLREMWPDATELAEELYAIFSSDSLPLTHDGPITLNKPDGTQAGITLPGYSSGDTIMSIPRADGSPITISLGDNGLVLDGGALDTPQGSTGTQQDATVFLGTVVSGSGATYRVKIGTALTVTATVPGINADETVPAGTKGTVFKGGTSYTLLVPLWL